MGKEKEYTEITAHWEEIERLGIFCTAHLKLRQGENELGYYRIWHSPETDNIAFYGPGESHGVMPPMEYQAKKDGHKMMERILADISEMGYYLPVEPEAVNDFMLIGSQPFLKGHKAFY